MADKRDAYVLAGKHDGNRILGRLFKIPT